MLQKDRLAMIMRLIPAAALVGGGLGGIAGMRRLSQTNQPPQVLEPDPILIGDTTPPALPNKKKPLANPIEKVSSTSITDPAPVSRPGVLDNLWKYMPKEQHAQPHTGIYGPSLVAASTLIPGYMAYQAMSGLGKDMAESAEADDVAQAEQEFQKARAAKYKAMMLNKQADTKFEQAMVKAAAEKQADAVSEGLGLAEQPYVHTYGQGLSNITGLPPHEAWRTLLGASLATGGVVSGLAALRGYNKVTSKTPEELSAAILEKRRQQLSNKPYSPAPELIAEAA